MAFCHTSSKVFRSRTEKFQSCTLSGLDRGAGASRTDAEMTDARTGAWPRPRTDQDISMVSIEVFGFCAEEFQSCTRLMASHEAGDLIRRLCQTGGRTDIDKESRAPVEEAPPKVLQELEEARTQDRCTGQGFGGRDHNTDAYPPQPGVCYHPGQLLGKRRGSDKRRVQRRQWQVAHAGSFSPPATPRNWTTQADAEPSEMPPNAAR